MSELTKLFRLTGTTSSTDIGPATGGVLNSVVFYAAGAADTATIRDGGSAGTIIAVIHATGGNNQLTWVGVRLTGQLNVTLSNTTDDLIIEMSEVL